MGAITYEERSAVRARSPIGRKYDSAVNRESAYEILSKRTLEKVDVHEEPKQRQIKVERPAERGRGVLGDLLWGTRRRQGMVETMAKQAVRTAGSQIGRQIIRGILGGILGGSRRIT